MAVIVRNGVRFPNHKTEWRMAMERFNSAEECVREVGARMRAPRSYDEDAEKINAFSRCTVGIKRSEIGDGFKCDEDDISDWSGCEKGLHTWSDVEEIAQGKKPFHLEEFRNALNIATVGTMTKRKTVLSVEGHTPCVPNALLGFPLDMYTTRQVKVNQKAVNIAVDCGAHCGISADKLRRANVNITKAVIRLETTEGVRCGIYSYLGGVYSDLNSFDLMVCKLKRPQDPLDIKRLILPMTTVAFFRVVGFNWWNVTPECVVDYGYGKTFSTAWDDDRADEVARIATGDPATVRVSASQVLNMSEEQLVEYIKTQALRATQKVNDKKRRR